MVGVAASLFCIENPYIDCIWLFLLLFLYLFEKKCTDYANRAFPSTACVLDQIRCSVTFEGDNLHGLMFTTLTELMDRIEKKQAGCIVEIVRIKNGLRDMHDWKSVSDASYRDIKFNVIIKDSKTNKSMIGEIQFLTVYTLKAKKRFVCACALYVIYCISDV